VKGRIIDLSRAAARVLGLIEDGHGKVRLEGSAP
jgi:rare lipoprotein A (peptidoglycan hydrolase)